MNQLLVWLKSMIVLVFVMGALLYFVPKEVYKKYIRFFMEMILMITFFLPVLRIFFDEDSFKELVSYDTFWQEMTNIQVDVSRLEYMQNAYYVDEYELSIESQLKTMLEGYGYEAKTVDVQLSDEYEIQYIELLLQQSHESTDTEIVIEKVQIGNIKNENQSKESDTLNSLKQEIMDFYQVEEEKLKVELE